MYKWVYSKKYHRLVPLTAEAASKASQPSLRTSFTPPATPQFSQDREPIRAPGFDDLKPGRKYLLAYSHHRYTFRAERNARAHWGDPRRRRPQFREL